MLMLCCRRLPLLRVISCLMPADGQPPPRDDTATAYAAAAAMPLMMPPRLRLFTDAAVSSMPPSPDAADTLLRSARLMS